jgi:hypothetical protein
METPLFYSVYAICWREFDLNMQMRRTDDGHTAAVPLANLCHGIEYIPSREIRDHLTEACRICSLVLPVISRHFSSPATTDVTPPPPHTHTQTHIHILSLSFISWCIECMIHPKHTWKLKTYFSNDVCTMLVFYHRCTSRICTFLVNWKGKT